MPLPAHVLHVPAGLGIDEATRPELIEFGGANLANINVRQDKRGELSVRNGFQSLLGPSSTGGGEAAYKVFADRGSVMRTILAQGYARAEAYDLAAEQWFALRGALPECTQRIVDLPSPNNATYIQDIAYTNGYVAMTWYTVSGVSWVTYAAVINIATGAVVSAPVTVSAITSTTAPLLVAVGNSFIFVRLDGGAVTIKAWYLDTSNGAAISNGWTAMPNLATDASVSGQIAVCSLPHVSSARAAVAYVNNLGGTSQATVKTFDTTGTLESQVVNTSSVLPTSVDVAGVATDTLWVSWNEANLVKARGLPPLAITTTALATTTTVVTATTGVTSIGLLPLSTAGQCRVIVNSSATVMQCHLRSFQTLAGAASVIGTATTVYAAQAASRPWRVSDVCYVPVIVADKLNVQQQVVVGDWTSDVTSLRPVACPAPGLSTLDATGKRSAVTVGTKVYFPLSIAKSGVASGSALVELDYASADRFATCAWGNSTYVTGGVTYCSDGSRVAETGFLVRPPLPTAAQGGTGITAVTGWRYVCVYEEVDADGNWHQSGLSTPSASTGAVTNKTMTVTTSPLTVSDRINTTGSTTAGVRVAFYRTVDGGNAPYYRVGSTVNDTTASTVTFADAFSDIVIAANAKLYSQVGVLGTSQDKRPPPGLSMLVAYNGMLVGATGSDVWSSGQPVSGEGAWFNPIFQVPVPGDGDIEALAALDGTLFVFKRRDVYAISGEIPQDNASAGGLGQPRRLAVDVGAISSVACTTALGVFFQSDRGIEILTRAQTVEWIGEAVQVTLDSFPTVTAMTVDPASSCVLVELTNGTNGRTLVYDLSLKTWVSTDRRVSSGGYSPTPFVDAPAVSGAMVFFNDAWRYAWLSTGGYVHYETPGEYVEADGSFVTAQFETPWLKHGLQQEQRVWGGTILFERHSAAGLKIEHAYDYADYDAVDDKVWTEAETLGERQLEWRPISRGQAMKFRITATAPAVVGTGEGFTFIGLSFDMAGKQGSTKGTPRLATAGRK